MQGINPSTGGASLSQLPVPRGMGRLPANSIITLDYILLSFTLYLTSATFFCVGGNEHRSNAARKVPGR